MPTRRGSDGAPIVVFEPSLEISPFTLFRRLEESRAPQLVDVRPEPGRRTLRGARSRRDEEWRPTDTAAEVVVFDDDGSLAVAAAKRLQADGFVHVRALFGGLDLYEFSLDPRVVGRDTFLIGDETCEHEGEDT